MITGATKSQSDQFFKDVEGGRTIDTNYEKTGLVA